MQFSLFCILFTKQSQSRTMHVRNMAEASHHSRFYQCIKKTGYLVKSPTSGKMGRWRKRWIMLVDSIVPCPNAGYERYARMEYYDVPENSRWCRDKATKLSALKLKGTTHSCMQIIITLKQTFESQL